MMGHKILSIIKINDIEEQTDRSCLYQDVWTFACWTQEKHFVGAVVVVLTQRLGYF